eukprot:SRR837773.13798.p2 GENE.SRR837773.13798~~SRR837773.13798.p2  ORF type:complete len:124 (+),score=7.80 SRR837773.13798:400-771(+)
MPKSQMGFLQFICLPTWNAIARFEQLLQAILAAERSAKLDLCDEPPVSPAPSRQSTRKSGMVHRSSTRMSYRNSISAIDELGQAGPALPRILAKHCLGQCEANFQEWKRQADAAKAEAENTKG